MMHFSPPMFILLSTLLYIYILCVFYEMSHILIPSRRPQLCHPPEYKQTEPWQVGEAGNG